MALALNRSPVRWEEVWKHFTTDLDKRTIIHAWLSSAALINATSLGYRAIYSVDGEYYLVSPPPLLRVAHARPCDTQRRPTRLPPSHFRPRPRALRDAAGRAG